MSDNIAVCGYYGIAFGIVGGIVWIGYYRAKKSLNTLKDIQNYEVGSNLLNLFKHKSDVLPYVAVTGHVVPDRKCITGRFNKDAKGVIQKISIKELKSEWRSTTKNWSDDSKTISCSWHAEPFSLSCNNKVKLRVSDALKADQLKLTRTFDQYEPVKTNAAESLLNFMAGDRVKGIQTTEEFLLSNAKLTAVGLVSICENGDLKIGPPSMSGARYILTTDSLENVIDSEESTVYAWKIITMLFAVTSTALLSYWFYKKYAVKYLESRRYNQLLDDMNHVTNSDEHNVCVVCIEKPRDVVILPCGHVCSCKQCVELLQFCPICRSSIQRFVPIYHS